MPQDTTIYWNGKGQLPALIDSLPLEEQQVVLNAIHQKIRDGIEPAPLSPFLFFGAIIIIISFLVIYSNNKNRKREDENTAVFINVFAVKFIDPFFVNLNALDKRFKRICFILKSSLITSSFSVSSISKPKDTFSLVFWAK